MNKIRIISKYFFIFIILIFINIYSYSYFEKDILSNVKDTILSLDNVVIDFYQYDQQNIQTTGKIFLKQKKIRIDYQDSNVLLIIKGNRLIYHDLELDQITTFFNHEIAKLNFFNNLQDNIENLTINVADFNNIEAALPLEEKEIKFFLDAEKNYLIKKVIINYNNSEDIILIINSINTDSNLDDRIFSTHKYINKKTRF